MPKLRTSRKLLLHKTKPRLQWWQILNHCLRFIEWKKNTEKWIMWKWNILFRIDKQYQRSCIIRNSKDFSNHYYLIYRKINWQYKKNNSKKRKNICLKKLRLKTKSLNSLNLPFKNYLKNWRKSKKKVRNKKRKNN